MQEQLLQRTVEAVARLERARTARERLGGLPRPGDLFVFRETAAFDLEWAVLTHHPQERRRLRVVPADLDPRVGSADVGVPGRAASGALTLRCRFGVWLDEDAFETEMRTGVLSPEDLLRGIRKREEIDRRTLRASGLERETEREPEYRDRARKVLAAARKALADAYPCRDGGSWYRTGGRGGKKEPPRGQGGSQRASTLDQP